MFGGFRERADATYAAAQGARHGVPRGRRARAGRAARGVVLRRAARRGADAAGRAGAQPGAHAAARRSLSAARAAGAARRRLAEERRAPADGRRCCGCTPSGCAIIDARSSSCAAGSPPRTRGCRWSRSRPSRATCTTSTGCATIGAALAGELSRTGGPPHALDGPRLQAPASRGRPSRRRHRHREVVARRPRSYSSRAVSSRCAPGGDVRAGGAAAPGAHARSCRPRRRTRSGCRARRRGTRCAPGSPCRRPWRGSARPPARTSSSGSLVRQAARDAQSSVHVIAGPPSCAALVRRTSFLAVGRYGTGHVGRQDRSVQLDLVSTDYLAPSLPPLRLARVGPRVC